MTDDIIDDYPDYLDDERGYAWDAWDVLPADVIARHDAIAAGSADDLDALDPAGLDDLDLWAYARVWRKLGKQDEFLDAVRLLLASKDEHRGLRYADVWVEAIESLSRAGACDEAALHLRSFRERWPTDSRADRLQAWIAVHDGRAEDGAREAVATIVDDAELLFEVAEDYVRLGQDAALLIARCRELAEQQGRTALVLDIDLLQGSH